jgi:hypothetical protein
MEIEEMISSNEPEKVLVLSDGIDLSTFIMPIQDIKTFRKKYQMENRKFSSKKSLFIQNRILICKSKVHYLTCKYTPVKQKKQMEFCEPFKLQLIEKITEGTDGFVYKAKDNNGQLVVVAKYPIEDVSSENLTELISDTQKIKKVGK